MKVTDLKEEYTQEEVKALKKKGIRIIDHSDTIGEIVIILKSSQHFYARNESGNYIKY